MGRLGSAGGDLLSVELEILPDADALARHAAAFVAACAAEAVEQRGRFLLALSGGRTPAAMLQALRQQPMPWAKVSLFQVDERAVPLDDAGRNLNDIRRLLVGPAALSAEQIFAMPVEEDDLEAAARRYGETLCATAGQPPVLDLVHLGLGEDGHTASLFPGDRAADVIDAWVAVTAPHAGHRRMTLTVPLLDRARRLLWLVSGRRKAAAVERLIRGAEDAPAGRVHRDRARAMVDRAAAGSLPR